METENIKFEFTFKSEYWNNPPFIEINIDDNKLFSGFIERHNEVLSLNAKLSFTNHELTIVRKGKTDAETKELKDGSYITQNLILEQLKIDNINLRNFLWHYSYFEPVYSESYASENNNLEKVIKGELFFGHNGKWTYCFQSPHYLDVVNKVRGNV